MALLVLSWFRHLVIRGILLFQTITSSRNSSLHRTTTATVHMVNYRTSCIVCQKNKGQWISACCPEVGSYMLPNHSSFTAIEDQHFLVGTHVHAALEKMSSQYLKKEFRSSARSFLENFTSTVLSTVADRSKLGQCVSCFCREI